MDNKAYWNEVYKSIKDKEITYDLWLDKFKDTLSKYKNGRVLDLGCGSGNNTLYLNRRGYKNIISCDYSEEALEIIKNNIIDAKTVNGDMVQRLPFDECEFDVVIADLSIHYFNQKTTKKVIDEIKRVLKNNGIFLCRVNSINDLNYGAMSKQKIEKHFYLTDSGCKRFFDEEDIKFFFKEWNIKYLKENSIIRYGSEKKAFEIMLKNKFI